MDDSLGRPPLLSEPATPRHLRVSKPVLLQAPVSELSVETLDESTLRRFPRVDEAKRLAALTPQRVNAFELNSGPLSVRIIDGSLRSLAIREVDPIFKRGVKVWIPIPERNPEMAPQSRRRFEASFNAEVALAALRGDRTLQDLAKQHKIRPSLIAEWRKQLLEGAGSLFECGAPKEEEKTDVNELYREIGQLKVERESFQRRGPDSCP